MGLIGFIAGVILILAILWDVFETVILPRRVTRRLKLTNILYGTAWLPSSRVARLFHRAQTREKLLSLFGPISLIVLLAFWAFVVIIGFALVLWGSGAPLLIANDRPPNFETYFYLSGVTFFTLGYGDVTPASLTGRIFCLFATATGFGMFALVISYLPVLYQAFSRREASISLLDARAGSPSSAVELLRRHRGKDSFDDLNKLLTEWERWSAELLESHLSYPVLCYFRSQHDNQSWLRALTTVLDTCAIVMSGIEDAPIWQARMTFAMARHAVVDISQVLRTAPAKHFDENDRLPQGELTRAIYLLSQHGINLPSDEASQNRLRELRSMYEPYVFALSQRLLMPLPPWILPQDAIDNWKTSAWGRIQ